MRKNWDESLDVVDITAPPNTHAKLCRLAKQNQLHIICQKPLSNSLSEAQELVQEFQDYSKQFAVHENHPYRPWFQKIQQLRRENFFGNILYLKIEHHTNSQPNEQYKLNSEQGIWLEYGTHLVDMMRKLLGEPQSVISHFEHINPNVRGESLAQVLNKYPKASANINTAWKPFGKPVAELILVGEKGEAHHVGSLTRGDSSQFHIYKQNEIYRSEDRSPSGDYVESFYQFQYDFAQSVLNQSPFHQTAAENLKTLRAAFAAYQADSVHYKIAEPPL